MNNKGDFLKLLIASFISQTGSHFLTLSISAFILVKTGSPVQSSMVFVFSYLPSVLIGARLGHWVDNKISKILIARNELISVFSTIICATAIAYNFSIHVLCFILALRSILVFIGRASSSKWLKISTVPILQAPRIKILNLTFFLSTALSGCLVSLVLENSSIWKIAIIDISTYFIAIIFYLSLNTFSNEISKNKITEQTPETLFHVLGSIFSDPSLQFSFFFICVSQMLFQGAYSALISYIPINVYKLGYSGVGFFQIAASIGIIAGFLIIWFLPEVLTERNPLKHKKTFIWLIFSIIFLLLFGVSTKFEVSLIIFLLMNFGYECIWLFHSTEFFKQSSKQHVAKNQFALSASAAFLMALSTFSYSIGLQYLGTMAGITLTITIITLIGFIIWLFQKRHRVKTV